MKKYNSGKCSCESQLVSSSPEGSKNQRETPHQALRSPGPSQGVCRSPSGVRLGASRFRALSLEFLCVAPCDSSGTCPFLSIKSQLPPTQSQRSSLHSGLGGQRSKELLNVLCTLLALQMLFRHKISPSASLQGPRVPGSASPCPSLPPQLPPP